MRLKALRNGGRAYPQLREGEEIDCDSDLAHKLISCGLAEAIGKASPANLKAVPDDVNESVEQAEADLKKHVAKAKGKDVSDDS